jgi:asparagine synthase (glutamine-hydrolysing)
MFAFALWDPSRQRLLLARDRLGKKPLYWTRTGDALVFGSELKALCAWPGLERAIDYEAIHQYLTYQYIPAPRSIFRNVHKLPAAHKLVAVRGRNGGWTISEPERYWRLPKPNARPSWAFDPIAEQEHFIELFRESVRLRMISDVPLGAFLSGGVDSSAVVAMMATLSDAPVKTFSIGSPHAEYDETKYARMVAERYGTDHQELILEPNAAEILPRLIWHYNEPYADASMIPTYYVCQMAREHVTVALNGDGGDEAQIGYPRYDTVRGLAEYDFVPRALAPVARRLIEALPTRIRRGRQSARLDQMVRRLAERSDLNSRRYAFTIVSMSDSQKEQAYGPAMRAFLDTSALDLIEPYFAEAPDFVSGANWADTHVYLPDDLMVKVDIASMAVSLESRSPLLDHKLMEWSFSLPQAVKTPGGVAKGLFKKAMEPYLPNDLLYRPKMGFGCPIDHWLRSDLKEIAYDVLLDRRAVERGIVDPTYVRRMLDEHVAGTNAHHTRLFALLNLELWFRMWSDQTSEASLRRPALGDPI